MKISKRTVDFLATIFLSTAMLAQIRPDVALTKVLIETTTRAEIFLDGVRLGEATSSGSFTIPDAKPGPHELRVVASGKRPLTRKIALEAGKINRFRADLEDFTGDLEVLTAPDAEILWDGKPAGVADGTGRLVVHGLKAMAYRLRAARAGYNAEEQSATVISGVLSTFTVDLKRIEAAEEGASAPPPDYVMQRRLSHGQAREIYFSLNSLELVSVGMGSDTAESQVDRLIEWDPSTGRRLKKLAVGYAEAISNVSPDLLWVAVSSHHGDLWAVKVLDAATGVVLREFPGRSGYFTPNSKRVVISPNDLGSDKAWWDLETGKLLGGFPADVGWLYSPFGS